LSLHSPFAFCVGPNILLNILLSITNSFCLIFSVKTQHSKPYTTIGSYTVKIYLQNAHAQVDLQFHHHHHWLDSPWWALAFLRSFAHSSL
jgi:hypothetical protein